MKKLFIALLAFTTVALADPVTTAPISTNVSDNNSTPKVIMVKGVNSPRPVANTSTTNTTKNNIAKTKKTHKNKAKNKKHGSHKHHAKKPKQHKNKQLHHKKKHKKTNN